MSDVSAVLTATKPTARSRVSNGSALLPSVDGRSVWARLMRDTLGGLISHLGGDASETQRMACRRIAALEAELVHLEDGFARVRAAGGAPEAAVVDLYQRISNTQRRLCESIGWQRVARDVTPSLGDLQREYAQRRATERPAGESAGSVVPETACNETPLSESLSGSDGPSERAGVSFPSAVIGEPAAAADADTVVSAGSPISSNDGAADG